MSRQICRFSLFSTLQRHFTILLLPALPFLTGLLPLLYFLPAAGHLFPPPPLCVNDGLDTKENSRIATRHTTEATKRPSGKNQEEKENLFPGRINRSGGERVEKG